MPAPHAASPLRRGFASLFVLALIISLSSPALAGEWRGEEVEVEGVLHVKNPADPMETPMTVELDELWRLGGSDDEDEEFFGLISRIIIDENGTLYALDSQLNEIKIYAPDGSYLRSIGREGEGPGEFRGAADMFFLTDGNVAVLQLFPGRIVTLTPEGEPGGDHPVPSAEGGGFVILAPGGGSTDHGLILSVNINNFDQSTGSFTRNANIVLLDESGAMTKTLHSEERAMNMGNPIFDEKIWNSFDRTWIVGADKRVYAGLNYDYEVTVWNSDGTIDRVVEREYEHRKRSGEELARWDKLFNAFTAQQVPGASWTISEFDKDVNTIYAREDGDLWVLSSRGQIDRPEGSLGVFDVFDSEGRFARQVTLMGEGDPVNDAYFIVGDRLFVVTDLLQAALAAQGGSLEDTDEEEAAEPMAIICYSLDGFKVGMR